MTAAEAVSPVTIRCGFCLTPNRVDLARAAHRPACGQCGRPILLDRPVKVSEEDFDATVLGELLVAKVDTDHAPSVAQRFGIRGIPTLILFKDGSEVGRSVGFEPERVRALAEEAVS